MREQALTILRCPETGERLTLRDAEREGEDVVSGTLVNESGSRTYPVVRSVPRFVDPQNYAGSFGFQWVRFRQTQLDSFSGTTISADRFFAATNWRRDELQGKRVLDVGCGAGRFAEVALSCGANVVALDYSDAVDACWANLGTNPRLTVVQGDVYKLPFEPGSFDYVYCLGVLQHTPDPHAALRALPPMLHDDGRLVVDVYGKSWRSMLLGKYWVRPLTRRMSKEKLLKLVQRTVPVLLPVSDAIGRIPVIGHGIRRMLPVSNYRGILPLTADQIRDWAILDTFDMLSPRYDHPQNGRTLRDWLVTSGLRDVEVLHAGHLVGRGRR